MTRSHAFFRRVEGEQQLDHVFIRAAVQRTFQRADGGGDRRINIGKRGGRDARGEGGGVQFMLGVQHQRDVEGPLHDFIRLLAGERVEEIRREAKLGIAGDHGICRCAADRRR